jgi:hypothetical protein
MPERIRLGAHPEVPAGPCAPRAARGLSNAGLARMLAPGASAVARRRAAAALGVRSVARQSTPPPPTRPATTAHGPNPSAALELINRRGTRQTPTSVAQARRQAEAWAAAVIGSLRAGAAASGASHSAAIIENTERELAQMIDSLIEDLEADRDRLRFFRFHEKLVVRAQLKMQEIGVEFGHNVILESDRWGRFGSGFDEELTAMDEALRALPPGEAWGSARPIHFRRANADPSGRAVGGETDAAAGTITLYDLGIRSDPYVRSRALGLPGSQQTVRHEVGHLVEHGLTAEARRELFGDILDWQRRSWAWITAPTHDNARAERAALVRESGIADNRLDAWLAQFRMGELERSQAVEQNGRLYLRAEGTGHFLHSLRRSEVPQGVEFEYALSNQGDYISELYAFALSRPDWLAGRISARQLRWWRERVFSMPGDDREVARQLNVPAPAMAAFLAAIRTKFTWEQADEVLRAVQAAAPVAPAAPATP